MQGSGGMRHWATCRRNLPTEGSTCHSHLYCDSGQLLCRDIESPRPSPCHHCGKHWPKHNKRILALAANRSIRIVGGCCGSCPLPWDMMRWVGWLHRWPDAGWLVTQVTDPLFDIGYTGRGHYMFNLYCPTRGRHASLIAMCVNKFIVVIFLALCSSTSATTCSCDSVGFCGTQNMNSTWDCTDTTGPIPHDCPRNCTCLAQHCKAAIESSSNATCTNAFITDMCWNKLDCGDDDDQNDMCVYFCHSAVVSFLCEPKSPAPTCAIQCKDRLGDNVAQWNVVDFASCMQDCGGSASSSATANSAATARRQA